MCTVFWNTVSATPCTGPGQARDQREPVSGKGCDLNSGTALTLVIVVCVVALAALIALGLVLHRSAGLLKAHGLRRSRPREQRLLNPFQRRVGPPDPECKDDGENEKNANQCG